MSKISKLLAPVFERYDMKRNALQEEFKNNGSKFNEDILFKLIFDDLSLREELGEQLIMEYVKRNISGEELKKTTTTTGQGVFWDTEASISMKKITDYEIGMDGTGYTVKINCTMDSLGAHEISESEPSHKFPADMVVKITEDLEIKEIQYNDKIFPGTGLMRK